MTKYTPTTDEVDTGYTTFAWELAKEFPGEYPADANFTDYHEVCAAFRRWLAEVKRKAAEKAWDEGHSVGEENTGMGMASLLTGLPAPQAKQNPYRKEKS